jgi:hypothetical protein
VPFVVAPRNYGNGHYYQPAVNHFGPTERQDKDAIRRKLLHLRRKRESGQQDRKIRKVRKPEMGDADRQSAKDS